jgi:DNA-binding MarR family transcriptional regulator
MCHEYSWYSVGVTARWLNPLEDRAWRGFRTMFRLLEGRLARELAEETGLSMADYTVLSNLVEAEHRAWRITELAEQAQWSQSRLSHQIRRMEERGLVQRDGADNDARGTVVVLTRSGLRAIAEAAPGHFRGVRRHLIDLLTPEQLHALADIADSVIAHIQSLDSPREAVSQSQPGQ